MQVRGLDQQQLEQAATDAGVQIVNFRKQGRGFAFTLGLQGQLWQRRAARTMRGHKGPRRMAHVCFHGHAAYMQRVFDVNPDAIVITKLMRYDGLADFQQWACETGQQQVGWVGSGAEGRPLQLSEACDCTGELAEARV